MSWNLRSAARDVVRECATESKDDMVTELRRRIPENEVESVLRQALYPYIHDVIGGERAAPGRPAAPRPNGKVATLRATWREYLDTVRYTVADGSVRRLGDMSADDLEYVAKGLRDQAVQFAVRATSLDGYREAVLRNGAARVRDVPDDELMKLS
jgi:hypothetical protein